MDEQREQIYNELTDGIPGLGISIIRAVEEIVKLRTENAALVVANYEMAKINMDLVAELERVNEKLSEIGRWCMAYPLDIFPEPDWVRAKELLAAGGMVLDSVTCGAMRRVTDGIQEIIGKPEEV